MDPIVPTGIDIPGFIRFVNDEHTAPSVMVACMEKEAFIERLLADVSGTHRTQSEDNHADAQDISTGLLQQPSLRFLATSQTVKLVFCPDLSHLRTYLASFSTYEHSSKSSASKQSFLAILNLLEVHRSTSAFSAQGLNRTLSLAVEAAHRTGSRLIVAECVTKAKDAQVGDEPAEIMDTENATSRAEPWDEEVSILNVTTKSFGAGGRGWVGRTVKLRHIAERWCRFESLS